MNNPNTDTQNSNENEEHVIHMPHPYAFKVTEDYDYLQRGPIKTVGNIIMRVIVFIFCNIYNRIVFGLRITGYKNLKALRGSGAVVISNHVHTMDCTFIDCLIPFKRLYYVTLEENFQIPFVRHLIRILDAVPLPSGVHAMKYFMDNMDEAIKYKNIVCVYPECFLHPYHRGIRKFKRGAFQMSVKNGCPVIPLVVTFRDPKGLYKILKKKPCVTITVLPAVFPKSTGDMHTDVSVLMNECYENMKASADKVYN